MDFSSNQSSVGATYFVRRTDAAPTELEFYLDGFTTNMSRLTALTKLWLPDELAAAQGQFYFC
jgi:hypothetical protein